eukprot:scaffold249353_cov82-Cyclotella_meneghiniana.AAC.9
MKLLTNSHQWFQIVVLANTTTLGWTKSAMGSLQTSILHSDGEWVWRQSKPEISERRGMRAGCKSLIFPSRPTRDLSFGLARPYQSYSQQNVASRPKVLQLASPC